MNPCCLKTLGLVTGMLCAAVCCANDALPDGRVWYEENFEGEMGDIRRGPRAFATVRNNIWHVDVSGKGAGELVIQTRYWEADPNRGASVEARVQVATCFDHGGVMLGFDDGVHSDYLTLFTDRIELRYAGLSHAMDTTDGFHVYRVDIKDRDVMVSVDGELVIDGRGRYTNPAPQGRNFIRFGSGRSVAAGESFWDWIRWTAPAYERRPHEMDVPDSEHVIIFKQDDRYACFPRLLVEPQTGFLYTRFRDRESAGHVSGSPGDRQGRKVSRDGGRSWEKVSRIPAAARDVRPSVTFEAPDGALIRIRQYWDRWYPNERLPEFEGKHHIVRGSEARGPSPNHFAVRFGGYAERSEDGGENWTRTPIPELDTYTSSASPWSYTQLPDGTVLHAFAVGHIPGESRQVYATMTRDGKNVEVRHVMGEEPGGPRRFTEETLVHATSEGVIWMLTRVHGEGDVMWQALSRDNGRTWTSRPTEIAAGRTPPSALVELGNGRLLLVYGYRRPPFGIRALISEDEGLTWRTDRELVLRDDGAGFDLGYPHATKLEDGTVIAVYYYHTSDQIRHIACTRFRVPDLD